MKIQHICKLKIMDIFMGCLQEHYFNWENSILLVLIVITSGVVINLIVAAQQTNRYSKSWLTSLG